MPVRFAFAGFRHGHVFSLLSAVKSDTRCQLVAACEEDSDTRASLAREGKVQVTHDDFDAMLRDVNCDVVAIGDYYAKRGTLAIKAMQAGRHVILDKPICTRLDELEQIDSLASQKHLAVSAQFDLRGRGVFRTAHKLIEDGAIGQVHTVSCTGQHPLLPLSRPAWYFQDGKHGGTINDLFIHAADSVEWLSGRRVVEVVAARAWNARVPQSPKFQDGAQVMLRLDNNGGVLCDVSYLAPEKCGFAVPSYWRFVLHGSGGMIEFDLAGKSVLLAGNDDAQPRHVPAEPNVDWPYMNDFLAQVTGQARDLSLSTAQVIRASRLALTAQHAADQGLCHVPF